MANISRRNAVFALAGIASAGLLRGSAHAQAAPMRIGLITHLSGFALPHGSALRAGAEISADKINAEGGVLGRKIELVIRDDRSSTDGAVAAYRELSDAGVKFFVAGPISGMPIALAPLVGSADALLIAAGPSSLTLTHEAFNTHLFRLAHTTVAFNGGAVPTIVEENPTVLKWAAVAQDAQATTDIARIYISGLKKHYPRLHKTQIQVADIIPTKGGAGDFRGILARLAASDADGLVVSLSGADAITFYKQARAYQLDQKFKVIVDNGQEMSLAKALGSNMPKNLWSAASWYHGADPDNKVSNELYSEYVKRTGDKFPFGFVGNGHDSILLYASAARAAGSVEPSRVGPAIEQGSPQGAMGKLQFRKEDHALLGNCNYLKFTADPQLAEGFKVSKIVRISGADALEPASPGKPYLID